MMKKVIQVPIDARLLNDLDYTSQKQGKARAELIREACQLYLKQVKQQELDSRYKRGYQKTPEKAAVGEAQLAMTSEIMPKELW